MREYRSAMLNAKPVDTSRASRLPLPGPAVGAARNIHDESVRRVLAEDERRRFNREVTGFGLYSEFMRNRLGGNAEPESSPNLGKDIAIAAEASGPSALLGFLFMPAGIPIGAGGYLLHARSREQAAQLGLPAGTPEELAAARERAEVAAAAYLADQLGESAGIAILGEAGLSGLSPLELLRLKEVAASHMIGIMEWTDP